MVVGSPKPGLFSVTTIGFLFDTFPTYLESSLSLSGASPIAMFLTRFGEGGQLPGQPVSQPDDGRFCEAKRIADSEVAIFWGALGYISLVHRSLTLRTAGLHLFFVHLSSPFLRLSPNSATWSGDLRRKHVSKTIGDRAFPLNFNAGASRADEVLSMVMVELR